MDSAFFLLAKLIGFALQAETWIAAGLVVAFRAVWRGRRRLALRMLAGLLALLVTLSLLPVGEVMMARLEARYPPRPAPPQVDGIVVLGWFEDFRTSQKWGVAQLNYAAERLTAAAELALAHPQARVVMAGGTARLMPTRAAGQPLPAIGRDALTALGVAPDRILWDDQSRNTAENARNSVAILDGVPQGTWVLVTSAFHMDRALRSFAAAGWPDITPYPVDYRSGVLRGSFRWSLSAKIEPLNTAIKEYVGRIGYWLTGQ